MTAEVASEVSSCTCFHPRLWRSGTEGWNGAGVVRDRAGRGGWEDYSSRSAPRRLSLRGPAAETPPAALRTRGPVPTSGFRHLGIHSYVAPVLTARAAGLAALSQPAPPSPLARFLL